MIKVMIVEDNNTIRNGLEVLINGTDDYHCLATFKDGEAFLENISKSEPDVVLMDIKLPGISGIECVEKVKKVHPLVSVLMLTVYEDNHHIFEALCKGACGYLLKNTQPSRLLEAIKDARDGGAPMSSQIARKVVTLLRENRAGSEKGDFSLTAREKDVLNGLVEGNCYKAIADSLFISVDTVRHHIRNIYRKLQVHSQTEAVAKAIKRGIV